VTSEVQPNVLVGLCVAAIACTTGIWFGICMIAFGHWKPNYRLRLRRFGHLVIFGLVTVVTSQSQNSPAQAQDSTRRIERLEDQSRSLEGLTRELSQFSQSQANRVNELVKAQTDTLIKVETALANHDTRLKELESGLVRFEAVAAGVDGTVKMIGGGLSLVIAIGSGIIVWQQKKKPHWANGPLDKIIQDQDDILKLLAQSQPRRRTR
jgi:hypothetical protein